MKNENVSRNEQPNGNITANESVFGGISMIETTTEPLGTEESFFTNRKNEKELDTPRNNIIEETTAKSNPIRIIDRAINNIIIEDPVEKLTIPQPEELAYPQAKEKHSTSNQLLAKEESKCQPRASTKIVSKKSLISSKSVKGIGKRLSLNPFKPLIKPTAKKGEKIPKSEVLERKTSMINPSSTTRGIRGSVKLVVKSLSSVKSERALVSNNLKKSQGIQVSKRPQYEEIKKKIGQILEEEYSQRFLESLNNLCEKSENEIESIILQAQNEYLATLDRIYSQKLMKVQEINQKYEYDLFRLVDYIDPDNTGSVSNIIYNNVLTDKNCEIKEIEEEFLHMKEEALDCYREKIEKEKEMLLLRRRESHQTAKTQITENLKASIKDLFSSPIVIEKNNLNKTAILGKKKIDINSTMNSTLNNNNLTTVQAEVTQFNINRRKSTKMNK